MGHLRYQLIIGLLCGIACARDTTNAPPTSRLDEYMETGMEIAGVRAPYYDEAGNLRAQLYGGQARMLEGGMADVTNLRIDVYEDGEVAMTVFAPKCLTKVVEKGKERILMVESDGDVLIDMDEMTISGRGFRFSSDSNRFEIHSDAKVLVKESARKAEEVTL